MCRSPPTACVSARGTTYSCGAWQTYRLAGGSGSSPGGAGAAPAATAGSPGNASRIVVRGGGGGGAAPLVQSFGSQQQP